MTGHTVDFGFAGGRKVLLAVLSSGRFVAKLSTYGAALVWYGTEDRNYVLSHESAEEYVSDPTYMGKVVGPCANRIRNAEFTVDGKRCTLEKNDGENSLHSASACYGSMHWTISGLSNSSVTMTLSSPSLGGFPGEKEVSVTYTLSQDGVLTLFYRTTSSEKCPVSITNHAYFILDEKGSRGVELTIPSKEYIDVDSALIPLARNPVPVEGTPFDFREPMTIGSRRDGRYDNSWVLEKGSVIKAEGDLATLLVRTEEPGVQVYTGEYLPYPFQALALETGKWPDFPNRVDFPQSYTESGMIYETSTSYLLIPKE